MPEPLSITAEEVGEVDYAAAMKIMRAHKVELSEAALVSIAGQTATAFLRDGPDKAAEVMVNLIMCEYLKKCGLLEAALEIQARVERRRKVK